MSLVPNPMVNTRTRRSAACRAASRGSTPVVAAPSVSRTTTSGTYLAANRSRSRSAGVRRTVLGRDLGVHPRHASIDVEHAVADRGADRRGEAVDGVVQAVPVGRGRAPGSAPLPAKATSPRRVPSGWSSTNLARRLLRRRQPVREHVGRAHRPRHVEREDDRGVAARGGDERLRAAPSRPPGATIARQQQRGGNDAAATATVRGCRVADERQTGERHRVLAAAAPQPCDGGDDRPAERRARASAHGHRNAHGQITRPYQRIDRPAATRNSRSPAPATIAVISVFRPATVSFRSMVS